MSRFLPTEVELLRWRNLAPVAECVFPVSIFFPIRFHVINWNSCWYKTKFVFLRFRDLSDNQLTRVPSSMFPFCKNLTILWVELSLNYNLTYDYRIVGQIGSW